MFLSCYSKSIESELFDLKLIDYSGLTSNSNILDAVTQEFKESKKVAVIVEI